MQIQFGVGTYKHRSLPLSAQRMVNCYLEPAAPKSKTLAAVIAAYGTRTWGTAGSAGQPCRGGKVINGVPYAVIGPALYSFSSSGTATLLGTVSGSGSVIIAGDGVKMMIVTDSTDYFYNGTTVAAISDTDYPGSDWVENLDGYYCVSIDGELHVSANRDPSDWDALDFATAEKYPDDIVRGIADHNELILFGRESGEAWYDSGDADFPLTKVPSGDFEVGIYTKDACAKADNTVFFLGHDGVMYRLNGYTPLRVSTHAVEQAVEDATDKNFKCFSWKESGHEFVSLTCTEFTLIYDVSSGLWHNRESFGYDYWRAAFVLLAYNKLLVGDSLSNAIGELNADTFTEYGNTLRLSCVSGSVSKDNKRVRHSRLELVFEQGVGLTSGQGSDPQIMLRWSDDGGRTWSNEVWRSLGAIGAFKTQACWNRLGQAKDRVYEYAISDPVRRTLIQATTEVEIGGY